MKENKKNQRKNNKKIQKIDQLKKNGELIQIKYQNNNKKKMNKEEKNKEVLIF